MHQGEFTHPSGFGFGNPTKLSFSHGGSRPSIAGKATSSERLPGARAKSIEQQQSKPVVRAERPLRQTQRAPNHVGLTMVGVCLVCRQSDMATMRRRSK
jgi:hypothetical protein